MCPGRETLDERIDGWEIERAARRARDLSLARRLPAWALIGGWLALVAIVFAAAWERL